MKDAILQSDAFRLHPLGFYYLRLSAAGPQTKRIHVWLPNKLSPNDIDQHQHSYDLNSRIITGRMRSELFSFNETSDGHVSEFAVSYNGIHSTITPTGKIGALALISAFECIGGCRYFLPAGIVHRVHVTELPCVTIATTEERGVPTLSYGVNAGEPPFERRPVNLEEAQQIKELLTTLADSS